MDNIVTPPLSPGLPPSGVAAEGSGRLTGLLPENLVFRPGETLLLETLLATDGIASGTTAAKTFFSVSLLHNGQSFPLTLKLEAPLPLDTSRPHQLEAKIAASSAPDSGLTVRLTSVDQRSLPLFLRENTSLSPSRPTASPAIIQDAGNPSARLEILPLPLKPVIQNLMTEFKISPSVAARINDRLPPVEVKAEFLRISPQSGINPEILAPLRQTLRQIAAAPADVEPHINRMIRQINELNGQTLTALPRPVTSGEAPLLVSPLGPLSIQPPLKLAPGDALVLQITDILRPVQASPLPAQEPPLPLLEKVAAVLSRLPGTEALRPEILAESLSRSFRSSQAETSGFLRIISPLLTEKTAENPVLNSLLSAIAEKIPAPGPRMLANLHNFYRAAHTREPSRWLGSELVQKLETQGAEGRQVLAGTTDFFAAQTREGISWRQVEIPFFDGSQFNQVRLAVKKKNPQEEDGSPAFAPSSGTRFLLETDFSRLGSFQFDGFSRTEDRHFDLIIRTSRTMPKDFCAHVINLFKTSLYDVNYGGSIKINQLEPFFKVMDETAAPDVTRNGVYI